MNGSMLSLLAALVATAGVALANEDARVVKQATTASASTTSTTTPKATAPDFTVLYADGNGSVTLREAGADASVAARFASYDLDRDGTLSRAEFDGYVAAEDIEVETDED